MTKIIVVDELTHELPFKEAMNWETFQFFCTDLLSKRHKVTDVREYLTQGNKQDGIDIYATTGVSQRMITAQCKLEKYLSPKELDDIIDLFLKGEFAIKSSDFILCTNFDLSKHREDEKNIASIREKLDAVGVNFIVWDKNGLEQELRSNPAPDLLCRYFNMHIAQAFYGPVFESWYKDHSKIDKIFYKENHGHITRKLTYKIDYYESINNPYYLYWNDRYVNLFNLIDEAKKPDTGRYLVLSIAGFGKTFEMENVAAHYASDDQYLFPIKIYLRDYEGQSIPRILEMLCARWKDLADEQRLLLVLDGLDEIKENHYQTFFNHLNLFCESVPKVKVIVSTRFNFYDLSNPSLRNFEILILHPLNKKDVDDYVTRELGSRCNKFQVEVKKYGFEEYLENPYYLSRLVKIYRDNPALFPTSKPELFDNILFEFFNKDNSLNANPLTKADFLRFSQKIAYCMTVLGKPALTTIQMEQLLISAEQLKVIKKYFLLNKNATTVDNWSFEHKNLQEYLCASFLQLLPFNRLLEITTYPYNHQKIQTKFINAYSFLFILYTKDSEKFKMLLTWLIDNQQELLIRFERGRIPRSTRLEIGKRIMSYYCSENLSLFSSSGFSVQELADFVEINDDVIVYIDRMIDEEYADWYAYYGMDIIAQGAKGYVYKEILNTLLLKVLANSKFSARVHANAIDAFVRLELFDQFIFSKILSSPVDLINYEVRTTLVSYLNSADFREEYIDFLIETISVFEQMENKHEHLGSSEMLKNIILRSTHHNSIRKILDFVLRDKSTLSLEETGDSKITPDEFKGLMLAASNLYTQDPSVLDLVLSFYVGYPTITLYGEWLVPIVDFFKATVGLPQVFHRVYQLALPDMQIMQLAGKAECTFLLDEYQKGKIKREQMIIYRNVLSHSNRELFEYFYAELNSRFDDDFLIADKDVNYQELWESYHLKNQQMLEDRSLFINEVEEIFAVLGLDTVTKKDFHNYQDYKLRKYQQSIALSKLRLDADKIPRTKAEMIATLQDEENWKYYRINEISRLLNKHKHEPKLLIEKSLLSYAETWIKEKILDLDYLHCIEDNSQGTVNFDLQVEFNNNLYMKLEPELRDDLLLKMIPSDFRGGMDHRDLSLSGVIISKVKDQDALKNAVFNYLKMNLSTYVQKTLFAICEKLNYVECLSQLYDFITTNRRLAGSDKNFLTDIYIGLGGEIIDFKSFILPVSKKEESYYLSWNWYLIENLLDVEPNLITSILSPILNDVDQPESHRILAAEYLVRLKKYEGMEYWSKYILTHGKIPFETRPDYVKSGIHLIPTPGLINLLFQTMEPFIVSDSVTPKRPRNIISDYIADLFLILVSHTPKLFLEIDPIMEGLIIKYNDPKPRYWLKRYRREVTQEYHHKCIPELTIREISEYFESSMESLY